MKTTGSLLFHRFAQDAGRSAGALDSAAATIESVIHEVTTLLDSRSCVSSVECAALARRTVLDYGLADFLHFSPLARQDAQQLACIIRDAVSAHEPRLRLTDVTVETPRPCRDVVSALICGQVMHGGRALPQVQFKVRVATGMSTPA